MKRGFTLVEILIVVAVFMMITTAVVSTYVKIFDLLQHNKMKISALNVANEQIEVIRNMPYVDVGEVEGIPVGKIVSEQTIVRSGITFTVSTTIRNVDDPFDGQIGSSTSNDLSPADYKMAEVIVAIPNIPNFVPINLITYVAPKNLEGSTTNGALFVKVFDANGVPIQGATVHILNEALNPDVDITDVTNAQGMLNIVDVPPSGGYKITVTKTGYSTDGTYPTGGSGNPNPTKPDATVVVQQVTQVSFAIDRVSTMIFEAVDEQCQPVSNIPFSLQGSKLIGTPSVYKYSQNLSTGSSGYSNSSFEWDSYSLNVTSGAYDLIGSNPLLPINLLPNSTQSVQLVVGPNDPNTVLFGVIDNATGLPLTDARISISIGNGAKTVRFTGRGFTGQTDWSGGNGQTNFTIADQYFSDDGNVNVAGTPGELILQQSFGDYVSSGVLTSSIFNVSTTTNFKQIVWTPNDQPPATGAGSVRLQIATSDTNTSTTSWNYVGPDETSGTYFTTSNQNISSGNSGQYIRYKAYLATASSTFTPNLSDVNMTYTSSCVPPGQAVFTNLSSGTYDINVSKSGYQDYDGTIDVNIPYQSKNIILTQ